MGRRCSRSVGVLTTNCFKLRYEQDRKGRNQGGCLRQPETGLPGPGGHIPTSIHTCPFPAMPGTCLSLASGATHGRRPWYIHTSCFKIPGWMRRRQPHTEVHVQQHLYAESVQRGGPKSTAPMGSSMEAPREPPRQPWQLSDDQPLPHWFSGDLG